MLVSLPSMLSHCLCLAVLQARLEMAKFLQKCVSDDIERLRDGKTHCLSSAFRCLLLAFPWPTAAFSLPFLDLPPPLSLPFLNLPPPLYLPFSGLPPPFITFLWLSLIFLCLSGNDETSELGEAIDRLRSGQVHGGNASSHALSTAHAVWLPPYCRI